MVTAFLGIMRLFFKLPDQLVYLMFESRGAQVFTQYKEEGVFKSKR